MQTNSNASPPGRFAIQLLNVSLSFGEKQVLSDISLELSQGETMVLLGVTGSGKSVLLKVILGLLQPDSGQVLIEGVDIVPMREQERNPIRRRMGVVFQEGALFDSLSVYENVAFSLYEAGERDEAQIERRVRQVLSFVEMEDAIEKMPSELSGGMRRRVAIARSIIHQPSIMLYDSPTGGLDPVTAHTINLLITKLRDTQQVTSVLVTQRIADAITIAHSRFSPQTNSMVMSNGSETGPEAPVTHFTILREGRIYFSGAAPDLARTDDAYLRKFIA